MGSEPLGIGLMKFTYGMIFCIITVLIIQPNLNKSKVCMNPFVLRGVFSWEVCRIGKLNINICDNHQSEEIDSRIIL